MVFFKWSFARCVDKPTLTCLLPFLVLFMLLVTFSLLSISLFCIVVLSFWCDHGAWQWGAGGGCVDLQHSSKFLPYSSFYVVSFAGCCLVLVFLLVVLIFLSLCYSCYWSPYSFSHINCLFLFLVLVLLLLLCPFPCVNTNVGIVASHFLPLFMFLILVLSFFSHVGPIVGRLFLLFVLFLLFIAFTLVSFCFCC